MTYIKHASHHRNYVIRVLLCVWFLILANPLFAREAPAPVVDATAQSSSVRQIEQRITKLERKLDSQTLVDLLTRMDQIQQELQRMSGEIESINHEISGIKKRQRDLYVDLDRRISQIEKAPAVAQPGTASTPLAANNSGAAGSKNDGQAYEKAFRYLKDRRYEKAVTEFQSFLRTYPKSGHASKAQYWLGEANYVQQNYVAALADFTKVVARYPKSLKIPDAMLKMGYIYDTLGKKDKSTKILSDVVSQFPDSTAARLAKKRLKRLKSK